ncbi:MAG: DEAD/DEAH box helicase [Candidatus Omnitrophica bacterium]|nr:DEAD/DEAH box helicase [Candidatus Omnitrophota bacterium]
MKYDPFQKKSIDYIKNGVSVIVAAPTGAGKTVIAEHVIEECLKKGTKVIYTAPIKALSNQKFRDFNSRFPEQVGILTGDVSINAQASTLIMTTEIFRNKILEEKSSLKDYAWIIFDEIHYIDDLERGSVWEESLMFLPRHMKVLGLSATVPNVMELAAWFESIHKRPLKVVREHKRPVPLHIFYQCQNKLYDDFRKLSKEGFKTLDLPNHYRGRKIPRAFYIQQNKLSSLIDHVKQLDLMPCIYFTFSRKRTEYLAGEADQFNFLNRDETVCVKKMFAELCERFDIVGEPSVEKIRFFIERGIAYHHAGMLPTLKEIVEQLFTSRLIKVIFTTETFALGINMPARTVIFDELRKFYGRTFNTLKTRDFYQMAGRAGRRSIDKEGFVFCRINPHNIEPRQLYGVIHNQPEAVRSRFNAAYATVLNLYKKYGERLYDIYPLSFHYFQERKAARKKAVEMLGAKVKLLKEWGYIRKNLLTQKGLFAGTVYGYELILAELHENGLLDELSEKGLGILIAALVYEPRKGQMKPALSKYVRHMERKADKIINDIREIEKKMRIKPLSKKCFFHLSPAMEAWLRGSNFDDMVKETDVDEGEVVRYFRMTVQILREILDAPVSDALQVKAKNLIHQINRDIIDSEKQLRS